jgi:hypothetical protein
VSAPAFSGMRPLSDVLEHNQVMCAARQASLNEDGLYLFGILKDGTVNRYEITRRTAKMIFYVSHPGRWAWAREWVPTVLPDGTTGEELRYTGEREYCEPVESRAPRGPLERDGQVYIDGQGWPAGFGNVLYASRATAEAIASGDLRQLRRIMAGAHPDRGGDPDEFIKLHRQYERARDHERA